MFLSSSDTSAAYLQANISMQRQINTRSFSDCLHNPDFAGCSSFDKVALLEHLLDNFAWFFIFYKYGFAWETFCESPASFPPPSSFDSRIILVRGHTILTRAPFPNRLVCLVIAQILMWKFIWCRMESGWRRRRQQLKRTLWIPITMSLSALKYHLSKSR